MVNCLEPSSAPFIVFHHVSLSPFLPVATGATVAAASMQRWSQPTRRTVYDAKTDKRGRRGIHQADRWTSVETDGKTDRRATATPQNSPDGSLRPSTAATVKTSHRARTVEARRWQQQQQQPQQEDSEWINRNSINRHY